MALTIKDLLKIKELFLRLFGKRLKSLEKGQKQLNSNQNIIQDQLAGIREELDTEHKLRFKKVENNSKRINRVEQHLNIATQ